MGEKELIGNVANFFTKICVAVIELSGNLEVGDSISVEGSTTNFKQRIDSMQIDRKDIKQAKPGDAVGIKVKERTRPGDQVFRL
jgi:translation elongation factor EF-1alpha